MKDVSDIRTDISQERGIVAVLFYADWCSPCHAVEPLLDALARKAGIKALKLNVLTFEDYSKNAEILALPTIIIYKAGSPAARLTGNLPSDKIRVAIEGVVDGS